MELPQSVAVVHGHLLGRGGAEVRAEALARVLDAPLYAGFGDRENISGDVDVRLVFEGSRIARLRGSKIVRDTVEVVGWPGITELRQFDVLVFSGENACWFPPAIDQAVVRFQGSVDDAAYGRADEFTGLKDRILNAARRVTLPSTAPFADVWVTPSTWTARECERYLGREVDMICPPPIDAEQFDGRVKPFDERDDYVLTMSRLVGQKHVGEVIEACEAAGERLVVAGEGPDRDRLEQIAGPSVEFVGWVDGQQKRELLRNASAFAFAGEHEAFGIVTAEALAAGTPVCAVASGHTQQQIPRECGIICERGGLADALRRIRIDGVEADAETIHCHARERFSHQRFKQTIRDAVVLAIERAQPQRETLVDPAAETTSAPRL